MHSLHPFSRFVSLLAIAAGLFIPGLLAQAKSPPGDRRDAMRPSVNLLNELTERRRANVYFVNEQSPLYGAQVGFVNVGRGNFTFARRDLVVVGRIPIVVARVYDSSLDERGDFGTGWHLTAAEQITFEEDGSLLLRDESGSSLRFVSSTPTTYVQATPHPSDIRALVRLSRDQREIEVLLRQGWKKSFRYLEGAYRLTRVSDRNGNRIDLLYEQGRLMRLEGHNHRFVQFERDRQGRIVAASDDQFRLISYRYADSGMLQGVIDLGGNEWTYQYDSSGRMSRAFDPAGLVNFSLSYSQEGKAREIGSPVESYSFQYDDLRTRVVDGSGSPSEFQQSRDGITYSIRNAVGDDSVAILDSRNNVSRLVSVDGRKVKMTYDQRGRLSDLYRLDRSDETGRLHYRYGDEGRLKSITDGAGREVVSLKYDASGNVLKRKDAAGTTTFTYSERGDLIGLSRADGKTFAFICDDDGQITSVRTGGSATLIEYHPDGRPARTLFADGSAHSYRYDPVGIRTVTSISSGGRIEYLHNPSGGYDEIRATSAEGTMNGHRLELDDEAKVTQVEYLGSATYSIEYDEIGNPVSIHSSASQKEIQRFGYDRLHRLIETVKDGESVRYEYSKDEPDLRVQLDDKTAVGRSDRIRQSLTFGHLFEVLHQRSQGSALGTVAYHRGTHSLRLASRYGPVLPDEAILGSLSRIRLLDLGDADHKEKGHFEQPSNALFLPPEYRTFNCCLECDLFRSGECFCLPLLTPPPCICFPPPDPPDPEEPVLELLYTTFIPLDHLRLPISPEPGVLLGAFTGDNQINYNPQTNRFRVQQKVMVRIGAGSDDGIVDEPLPKSGDTSWHYWPAGYSFNPTPSCIRQYCGSVCNYTPFGPSMIFPGWCLQPNAPADEGPAPAEDMDTVNATLVSKFDNEITVRIVGAPVVAFIPGSVIPDDLAAAIDWSHEITLRRESDGDLRVTIVGSHDKFPTHDLRVNGVKIYSRDPISNGDTALALGFPFFFRATVNKTVTLP